MALTRPPAPAAPPSPAAPGAALARREALVALLLGGCTALPGGAAAQQARPAPGPGRVTSPAGAIALQVQNAGARPLPAGIATSGLVFRRGELPRGATLGARIGGGQAAPVQLDIKTRWPDGSARMAVLAFRRPALAPGQSLEVLLAPGAAEAAAPIRLEERLEGRICRVALFFPQAGAALLLDVFAELRQLLGGDAASYWQRGPLATQARVTLPVEGTSLRVIADVTAYAEGGLAVDLQFANDRAMERTGGRIAYTATIVFDGVLVARQSVDQGQYQSWRRRFATGADGGQGLPGGKDLSLNIRHDVQRLIEAAAVARYDLTLRVPETVLAAYARAMATPGWGDPLAANGVEKFMPNVGGRGDIGITTAPSTHWLLTQDARAAAYALGWAEASGAATWRYWDGANGTWLNAGQYPRLWVQSRGGGNPPGRPGDANSTGPTQFADGASGWAPEAAHQPDLSFVPYVLTGERWILDNLLAQAAWNTVWTWPDGERRDERTGRFELVVRNVEVRAAGWALRQLENAAWAAPDGSREQAYFRRVAEVNWAWLLREKDVWTAHQGEVRGYLPHTIWAGLVNPWQNDYFASVAILMAARGNAEARSFLDWTTNFLIGRFEQDPAVFNPRDGVAYVIRLGRPGANGWLSGWDAVAKTWAGFGRLTRETGLSNGDGWDRSQGNYGMWAMATLAGIWHLTGDARARRAYEKLAALNPPYTTAADFAREPSSPVTIPGLYGGTRR